MKESAKLKFARTKAESASLKLEQARAAVASFVKRATGKNLDQAFSFNDERDERLYNMLKEVETICGRNSVKETVAMLAIAKAEGKT